MILSKRALFLTVFLLAAIVTWMAWPAVAQRRSDIEPRPESEVELTTIQNGDTYKLYKGVLYRVNERTKRWEFVQEIYDPEFYAKNYVERDGVVFRNIGGGNSIPVKRTFSDDFEGARRLGDLIQLERGWTSCQLQSPRTPTIDDFVRLRKKILKGESSFLDNRIEPSNDLPHEGNMALKAVAVPPSRGMITSKASLSTELVHFVKGDDVWMSMWCYVPVDSGMPFTVLDLETTWIDKHPGMRIVIADGKHACFQLKGFGSPYYRQPKGREVSFPRGKWVNLKAHLRLSDREDGVIELWQDGQKIVDTKGQTLVLANAIYNSLEVGISAYNEKDSTATLYIDDVRISDQPIRE